MLKRGMYLLCRCSLMDDVDKNHIIFIKGSKYKVYNVHDTYVIIDVDDSDYCVSFGLLKYDHYYLYNYFYTIKEERDLKLDKLLCQ